MSHRARSQGRGLLLVKETRAEQGSQLDNKVNNTELDEDKIKPTVPKSL